MSDLIGSAAALWQATPALATAGMIVVKASVILLLTVCAARLARPLSAAKRHLLWCAGIGGAVIIPLATVSLPTWRIPVRYAASSPAVTVSSAALGSAAERSTDAAATPAPRDLTLQPAVRSRQQIVSAPAASPASLSFAEALVAVWLVGAVLSLWPWFAGVMGRSRLAASASDLLPGTWERSLRTLRADGLVPKRVRVLAAADCTTPMTWGIVRPVVLVPANSSWQEHERRNALLHEFAHVRRGDYLCKLGTRILCSTYWFNPLAWIAARGERLSREQACDDAVLRAGSRPSAYAQQLLEVAHGQSRPLIAAAALTMARRSNLARRLRAILDTGHDRSPMSRGFATIALGAVGLVLPPVATLAPEWVRVISPLPNKISDSLAIAPPPVLSQVPERATLATQRTTISASAVAQQGTACPRTDSKRSNTSITSNSDGSQETRRWQVRWSDGDCRIDLDARGTFRLSPNGDDVISISAGGFFELEQDDGRVERRVRIVNPRGSGLERTYWLDGQRRDWDADAASWFARTLIQLDRRTAFAVDVRLPMLLQRGGVDAVIAEVEQMTSSYPQRVYYGKLFERHTVSSEQLVRVLQSAARTFDSGYEKAELLLRVARQPTFAEPAYQAFAQMARSIDSDYEKRRALGALLARDDLKPDVVTTMLQATEGMKSDYELAELLLTIDRRYAVDDATRPYYVRAVQTIDSDYEQRRVMSAIMRSGDLSPALTGEIIAAAGRTMKGYELAEFLVQVSAKGALDQAASAAFFEATKHVQSDYERRRVLTTLLAKGQLTKPVIEGILNAAGTIESDYECAEVLVALSRVVKIDDTLRSAFDKAAASINSDYEYGRAMSAARRSAQRSEQ